MVVWFFFPARLYLNTQQTGFKTQNRQAIKYALLEEKYQVYDN